MASLADICAHKKDLFSLSRNSRRCFHQRWRISENYKVLTTLIILLSASVSFTAHGLPNLRIGSASVEGENVFTGGTVTAEPGSSIKNSTLPETLFTDSGQVTSDEVGDLKDATVAALLRAMRRN